MAAPAPTPGLSNSIATAAAAPGALASSSPESLISIQDAGLNGARVGVSTAGGFRSKLDTDGTITTPAS
jgi:hypothetical protein